MRRVALVLIVAGLGLAARPVVMRAARAVQAADAEAHKTWMNDATDLQEDIRDAMRAKDGAKVAEAATKIEALMAKTEDYWTAKKAADIVKLAQTARTHARELAASARAAKFDQSAEAFGKLNTTCNTCHDLHPEKR
ncbi:MAG: cytochrome c [Acidobacteria bacterium]|nr:cytochrome c [Acidobacteriota bacterium]